jgi:hypothetical protein
VLNQAVGGEAESRVCTGSQAICTRRRKEKRGENNIEEIYIWVPQFF